MQAWRASLLVIWLSAAPLGTAGATPELLGYDSTALGREDLGRAIEHANTILGQSSPRLIAGWVVEGRGQEGQIAVWSIDSVGNPKDAVMEVPTRGCRCIVVRIKDLRAWIRRMETVNGEDALQFDVPYLLTFMLLHEIGHIVAGHVGRLDPKDDGSVFGPQERLTREQCREVEADAFAAHAIRDGVLNIGTSGWMAAQFTAMQLSKLSFNLMGKRVLDQFPANALGLAKVFGDPAYTHPNMDLRIYAVNADIAQDETAKALLEEFIGRRIRIGRPDLTCPR